MPIAQHAIGIAIEQLVDRERRAAAARQVLRARQRRQVDIVLLLRPQQRRQRARRRLQERRKVDMIGPEPHAVFAQRGPRRLVEILHLGRDLRTFQHAQRLDQLKCDPARYPRDVLGLGEVEQRPQQLFDMRLQPQIEPRLYRFARRAGQAIVGNDADAWMQRVIGRHQLCHGVAGPADGGVRCQHKLVVGGGR